MWHTAPLRGPPQNEDVRIAVRLGAHRGRAVAAERKAWLAQKETGGASAKNGTDQERVTTGHAVRRREKVPRTARDKIIADSTRERMGPAGERSRPRRSSFLSTPPRVVRESRVEATGGREPRRGAADMCGAPNVVRAGGTRSLNGSYFCVSPHAGREGGGVDGEAQGGRPRGTPVQKKSQLTSQLKSQLTEL